MCEIIARSANSIVNARRIYMRSKSTVFRAARLMRRVVNDMSDNMVYYAKRLFEGVVGGALYWGLGVSAPVAALGVLGAYLLTGGYEFAWVVIKTFRRDLRQVYHLSLNICYKL